MKIFYCYSMKLRDFFADNGLRYFNTNTNPSTDKRYWMYEGTEKLNNLLKVWRTKQYVFYYIKIYYEGE